MADEMDRVQAVVEAHRSAALAGVLNSMPRGAGAEHCADCGAAIPAARRAAFPAAETCIDCQRLREGK